MSLELQNAKKYEESQQHKQFSQQTVQLAWSAIKLHKPVFPFQSN